MVDRREVLKLTGAVATVGTAGCLEILASASEEQPPAYRDHIVTDEDGWVGFGYVDWDELTSISGAGADEREYTIELDAAEVMHGYPLEGVLALIDRLTVELAGSGLDDLLRPYPVLEGINADTPAREESTSFDSTVDAVMTVNESLLVRGSIDVEEIAAHVTESVEGDTVRREYERSGERNGYDVFVPVESDPSLGTPALAVGEEVILAAGDESGIEAGSSALETITDDGDRAVEEIDAFEWLLDHAGAGQVIFGGYGESTSFPPDPSEHWGNVDPIAESFTQFVDAKGAVGSLTFENDATTSAELAIDYQYDTIDDSYAAALRGRLASSASDRSIEVDAEDHRVRATATWTDGGGDGGNESVQQ